MKSIKDLNIQFKSKPLEDNMEGNIGKPGVSNGVFRYNAKSMIHERKEYW